MLVVDGEGVVARSGNDDDDDDAEEDSAEDAAGLVEWGPGDRVDAAHLPALRSAAYEGATTAGPEPALDGAVRYVLPFP